MRNNAQSSAAYRVPTPRMRAAPITNSTTAPIQDQNSGAGMPRFFRYPAKPVTFQSFPPRPPELARKSQPIRTRPTSRKASALLAAMLSVWDRDGCDDSVAWMDMVSPSTLLASLAFDRVSIGGSFAAWRSFAELPGPDDSWSWPR